MKYKSEPLFILIQGITTFTVLTLSLIISLFFVVNITYGLIILLIIILIVRYLFKYLIKNIFLEEDNLIVDFLLKKEVKINYNEIQKVVKNTEGFLSYHVYNVILKSKKYKRITIYCKNRVEEKEMIDFFKSKGVFVRTWES